MKQMRTFLRLAALGAVLGTLTAYGDEPRCRQRTLSTPVQWISSVVSLPSSGFAILDSYYRNRQVLAFDSDGSLSLRIDSLSQLGVQLGEDTAFLPLALTRASDHRLLLQMAQTSVWLDNELREVAATDPLSIIGKFNDYEGFIGSLYSNYVFVSPSRLVGYGSYKKTGETFLDTKKDFVLGFLTAQLDDAGTRVLKVDRLRDLGRNFYYLLGYPMIAAVNDRAFALLMGDKGDSSESQDISLARVFPDFHSFKGSIPPTHRIAPTFDTLSSGPDRAAELYREMDQFPLTLGLYGLGDSLYVLTRDSGAEGVSWRLYQYDHRDGALRGSVKLPTSSEQISILPGKERWLVFERGPVLPGARQDITTFLEVPASWIEEPARSPLNQSDIACIAQ